MEDIEIAIDSTGISIINNTPGHSKENSEDKSIAAMNDKKIACNVEYKQQKSHSCKIQ
ncbi:hypothetical protein HCR13_01565 [Wolbachia pipientis]|nr:hypothetical protein [Wolbachia pipientis]MBA8756846.1 hypothetical protein [Wolbachia pipientis]